VIFTTVLDGSGYTFTELDRTVWIVPVGSSKEEILKLRENIKLLNSEELKFREIITRLLKSVTSGAVLSETCREELQKFARNSNASPDALLLLLSKDTPNQSAKPTSASGPRD
jgi:hypothetical protein